jgi:hypothetical protein
MKDGVEDLLGLLPGDARAIYQTVHEVLLNHSVGFLLLMARVFSPAAPLLTVGFARLPARLAPLRRVRKTLLVEELLLARSPDKLVAAINAGARLVFKIVHF